MYQNIFHFMVVKVNIYIRKGALNIFQKINKTSLEFPLNRQLFPTIIVSK